MNTRGSRLLLHLCCAGCSPHVIQVLKQEYDVTGFFYNPNIHPEEEYILRLEEAKKLAFHLGIELITGEYDADRWFAETKGMEHEPEGGKRCDICFQMRLTNAAQRAHVGDFDFFTTTLTVSPHKNAALINRIGNEVATEYDGTFLESDFKKAHGFVKTVALCKEMGLYRQNYCGCLYSYRKKIESNRDVWIESGRD